MATVNRPMCAQEEDGVGSAAISIDYSDVSPFPVLTLHWQNTTSRSALVQLNDNSGAPIAGASKVLAAGTAPASSNISGLGLHMNRVTSPKTGVGFEPPMGCEVIWPAP